MPYVMVDIEADRPIHPVDDARGNAEAMLELAKPSLKITW